MGKVMTSISFWNCDWQVKEVISASNITLFNIKNLKEVAHRQSKLYEVDNDTYYLEFANGEFIEFK